MFPIVMIAADTVNVRSSYGVGNAINGKVAAGWPVLVWGEGKALADGSVWRPCTAISAAFQPVKGWMAEVAPGGKRLLFESSPAARLALPVEEGTRITQVYGENAAFYRAKVGITAHNGIDFGLAVGSPIFAGDSGVVLHAALTKDGFGNLIKLEHSWGQSIYAHLSGFDVRPGERVSKGQQIGRSGNTGLSTGPHLHFGVRVNPFNQRDGWVGYCNPLAMLPLAALVIPLYLSMPVQAVAPVVAPVVVESPSANWLDNLSEVELLALCIWSEARGESEQGQIAVGWVVKNRVAIGGWFGGSVREVILKSMQFSWFNRRQAQVSIPQSFVVMAQNVLAGNVADPTDGATHFHKDGGNKPYWAARLRQTITIGGHIFYRGR